MPELPEVETVARQLSPLVKDKTVSSLKVYDQKLKDVSRFGLKGAKVLDVYRAGKSLVIEFEKKSGKVCFVKVHLRMTGRLIWSEHGKSKSLAKYVNSVSTNDKKHTRLDFKLDDGELSFVDTRRFGTVTLHADKSETSAVGVEPLTLEFNFSKLKELVANTNQEVKVWLLRQDKIVGLGNIYASEILFDSGIHPSKRTKDLDDAELKLIVNSTKKILKRAIKNCGTTFSDFQDTTGSTGGYQKYLKVYGRAGQECKKCGTTIEKFVQAQRSTFFCPVCQP